VRWPRVVYEWGSTVAERERAFPCDGLLEEPVEALFRAIGVRAPPSVVFGWLCQLRAAPYSYDWIDNRGRRSPRTLTPGLQQLEVGQRVMRIFRLTGFEQGRSITLLSGGGTLGRVACSYVIDPAPAGSRLLVKLLLDRSQRAGPLSAPLRVLLPPGDLLMMRRQLLNLKRLAEAEAPS